MPGAELVSSRSYHLQDLSGEGTRGGEGQLGLLCVCVLKCFGGDHGGDGR